MEPSLLIAKYAKMISAEPATPAIVRSDGSIARDTWDFPKLRVVA